jgi:glyoxalase/bleomycin resistance protein/dioxygenase superfamily protein
MPQMRFNHMELSFPKGTLTQQFRDEVDSFYADVLGWRAIDTEVVGQLCHLLQPDDGQFILLAESKKPMESPGYDHLGLLMETREEVDEILEECQRFAEKDDRMQLKIYDDLVGPTVTVHAFYVKYLLPIWFDVQCIERTAGPTPEKRWQYA